MEKRIKKIKRKKIIPRKIKNKNIKFNQKL